jgi:hypothetical protein
MGAEGFGFAVCCKEDFFRNKILTENPISTGIERAHWTQI